jgi:IclR family transcriptional regulator, acetate operon repressor
MLGYPLHVTDHNNNARVAQESDRDYTVRAVDRACDIFDLLIENPDGLTPAEIATATRVHRSTIFRYLRTLKARRYVEHDPDTGVYRSGFAFLPLYSRHVDSLVQRMRGHLESLRDQFGETANLGLLDGSRVIYLDIVESAKSMRFAARPGDRDPIHSTALGQAIAATLPPERVAAILDKEGMPAFTNRTITDRRTFMSRLVEVAELGYAVDDGENEPGGRCVAVALLKGRVQAAVSVSAPATRLPMEQIPQVAEALTAVADAVADEFGLPGEGAPPPDPQETGAGTTSRRDS